MALSVTSPVFCQHEPIPTHYTCDGANAAPPLEFRGVPPRAKSLALICEDPDAPSGTFAHWVLYNIPPTANALDGGAHGGTEGTNGFGKSGFGGPCPPKKDPAHHYHFHVYALDIANIGPAGLSREDALRAIKGHVIAEGELVGTYQRARE